MTKETFDKAEYLLDQIKQLKLLIGKGGNEFPFYEVFPGRRIESAQNDDVIREAVWAKVEQLQKEFEAL
jgi:hypothetical protein